MQKILLTHSVILLTAFVFAQSPTKINYQAVVRNSTGQTVSNGTSVKLRFTIHDVTISGTVVYNEIIATTANQFGLVNVEIGTNGNLAIVNWGNGAKYLQVETDVDNTGTYTDMGTSQLISVPYALYAANSAAGPQGPQGIPGATGLNGTTGPTGPAGNDGTLGSNGATGPTGPAGNDGTSGLNGVTGPTGSAGATGIDGTVGPTGPTGAAGSNASEVPIGTVVAWHKSAIGTPALPSGWMECNGQTVNDPLSPYNGQILPNLNGTFTTEAGSSSSGGVFLRGSSTSGTISADRTNNIAEIGSDGSNGCGLCSSAIPQNGSFPATQNPGYDRNNSNTSVKVRHRGVETYPGNMTVVWIIRIK